MPNGNALAPLNIPGVGNLQPFQPLNVGEALYRRGKNQLALEERRQRMGLAEEGMQLRREAGARASRGESRNIEAFDLVKEEAEREKEEGERKQLQERLTFYKEAFGRVKSQGDLDWLWRVAEERYGEDLPMLETTVGRDYGKGETVARANRILNKAKPLIKVNVTNTRLWDEELGKFVTALEVAPEGLGVEGPELSQAVKDVLAEMDLTEETATAADVKAARAQIREEGKKAEKPEKAAQITMTDVTTGRKIKVRRGSEEHTNAGTAGFIEGEYPAGRLPLTREQKLEKYNERGRVLLNNIAKLETTGGAEDWLMELIYKDDPKKLEELRTGEGVEDAVTELKSQLRRVVEERNKLLSPRDRAIQALEDAGKSVTEPNIAEIMRQQAGR